MYQVSSIMYQVKETRPEGSYLLPDMRILYDLIFIIFALCYVPIFVIRRKFHPGFLMRLGIYPEKIKEQLRGARPIWLHAVSVGEVLASRKLLEGLGRAYPEKQIIISTVTPTGNKIARSLAQVRDIVIYLPLDISFIVERCLELIEPSIFIIAETEIWLNLINCLSKRNVPIIVINARISDGSYKGYCRIKFLLKPILHKINLFCVQTEVDYLRLLSLGAEKEKIKITGNMKFDTTDYTDFKKDSTDYTDFRRKLGLKDKHKLLVAGSTHPGEEEIILRVYKDLSEEFSELRLLVAPRHPERSDRIEGAIRKFGFLTVRISRLNARAGPMSNKSRPYRQERDKQTVFLLDTIGQLISFYALADIVFIGGSLIKKGGHNILEPAALGKSILFGPWMFNFRDITNLFLSHKASLLVYDEKELKERIKSLLDNPALAEELGQAAKGLILQNQGASKRNLENIRNYCKRFSALLN